MVLPWHGKQSSTTHPSSSIRVDLVPVSLGTGTVASPFVRLTEGYKSLVFLPSNTTLIPGFPNALSIHDQLWNGAQRSTLSTRNWVNWVSDSRAYSFAGVNRQVHDPDIMIHVRTHEKKRKR